MKILFRSISHPTRWLMIFLISVVGTRSIAHPMPNSVVLLHIQANRIEAEVLIPLSELQAAFGHAVNDSADGLVSRLGPQLRAYLIRHIRPKSQDGLPWVVHVESMAVNETHNPINGTYRELTAQVQLLPPTGANVRHFIFNYDVVLHQVVTHKILVSVRQDWAQGLITDEDPVQVGAIELDIINNQILPLNIDLESGSAWTGFRAMVQLGIRHIAEGIDHLLFLLVLLLPAPLLVSSGRWGRFGGVRFSLRRLLRIVTAFTLGHSLTLLLGSLGWVGLPTQPVEILIALSILVSAMHALRPLFPGKEAWVAAGFGLVHGLAFASTLTNLRLDAGPMVLSILGFNLGIELMQLFVIGLTVPWLILLSQTRLYPSLRTMGALLASLVAIAWVVERVTGQANAITAFIMNATNWAPWLLLGMAVVALTSWIYHRFISTV